jgi:small GTP-binding protein
MSETVTRKICVLGDYAVGKTSLCSRFVHNVFSERYLTTVGVKIDTKPLTLANDASMKMVVWDIAGAAELSSPARAYVRGSHGLLLVCDGTRRETLYAALKNYDDALAIVGSRIPAILLINKADLKDHFDVDKDRIERERERLLAVYKTSAKSGLHVEEAFIALGEALQ